MSFSSRANSAMSSGHYDIVTIMLHWLTAVLVLVQFLTALTWNYVTPHDRYWRPVLETTHVSLGILLALVIIARVVWRFTGMRQLPAETGVLGLLSRLMYLVLYVLLLAEAVLGFVLRWKQGEDFSFFGIFSVPALMAQDKAAAHSVEDIHNLAGWAIIVLALGHTAAALYHHYILKDGTLLRMVGRSE